MATVSGLAGKAEEAKSVSSLVGDAVSGAEAGLRILVGGVEAVTRLVVEAHVHLRRVRRPEPGDDLCGGTGAALDLERGRERLAEVLDADGEAAAEIAGVGEAGCALARG